MNLNDALKKFIEHNINQEEIYSKPATVVSVNEEEKSCTVQPAWDEGEIEDVKLFPVDEGDGVLFIPKKDSWVIVDFIEKGLAYVSMFSQVEKVLIILGDYQFEISDEGIILNKGENGGLINIENLVNRINDLENDVNALQSSIRKWSPVSQDGGAALKTYLTSNYPRQNVKGTTNVEDYEDKNVKH